MSLKEKLQKLAYEKSAPCVSISLNTHRTYPDNSQDEILLKNLTKEAENRIINEFGKRPVEALLNKIDNISKEIDVNYNLDSLHIFLSNDTQEIIKLPFPIPENQVQITSNFALRPIIRAYSSSKEYMILLLSQSGSYLYKAFNDGIVEEIREEGFPFSENLHYITHSDKRSDPKQVDDMVREYFNKIDKAVVKIYQKENIPCIVICTEDNYSKLLQVADIPKIYNGYHSINYNDTATHTIAAQAWKLIQEIQKTERAESISEVKEAVAQGTVLTDLQEIYQAALDGKGDLLIIHHGFSQPVLMRGDRNFDIVTDLSLPNVIDDITSNIAWEVFSRNGRVIFTAQDEIKELGDIVMKTRY
ncbi:baeRF3 domain-containing protein [Elizabethkingia bruuniana]|uniref:baeRF3 domain-containing protein n=1 Tax=Elizabethkingia bruuniana TaxID=1756149 RepID=UPI00241C7976|nr:hypothetical protein [Elizabethkingia bruuniana]